MIITHYNLVFKEKEIKICHVTSLPSSSRGHQEFTVDQ